MKTSQFRHGKKLIQAWIPEEVLSKACNISMKGFTETIVESLILYIKSNKSDLELAIERYEAVTSEATRLKIQIDELTNKNLGNIKKEIQNDIVFRIKTESKQLSEKERQMLWDGKIKPFLKKKISESGVQNVLVDERLLNNFSKSMGISTGELKEKISTELV